MFSQRNAVLLSTMFACCVVCITGTPALAQDVPPITLPAAEPKCRTSTSAPVINICIKGLGCHWYSAVRPPTLHPRYPSVGRRIPGIFAEVIRVRESTVSTYPKPNVCVPLDDPVLLVCSKAPRTCRFFQKVPDGKRFLPDKYFIPHRNRLTFFDIIRDKDFCTLNDLLIEPLTGVLMRESLMVI